MEAAAQIWYGSEHDPRDAAAAADEISHAFDPDQCVGTEDKALCGAALRQTGVLKLGDGWIPRCKACRIQLQERGLLAKQ